MNFESMGLKPRLVKILTDQGLTTPTPIQQQAIPHGLNGKDVLGLAQTGTGKTAAFALPLLDAIMSIGAAPAPQTATGLILAPTRELAKQICDNIANYSKGSHLKVVMIVGGKAINPQVEKMRRGVDILVATPGRLIDLLDRNAVRLDQTQFLVLDEADQMLDMGFIHALRRIAPLLRKDRQTMMFSATMPKLMAELSKQFLKDPVRVEVSRPGSAVEKITQSVHFVAQTEKTSLLIELLNEHPGVRSLVFCRTKHGSERLMKKLCATGFSAASIHGNKSQGQRDRAIREFKSGEIDILVATDVAARGIDIPDVKYVYNYDLPNVAENYVHRIGRTARAGTSGRAVAFCSSDEADALRDIEKVLKSKIEVASGKSWDEGRRVEPGGKKPAQNAKRKTSPNPKGRRRRNNSRKAAA
ncbi:DEAD/DEAH box helicase [Rhodobacteraceae bacterium]|nr:DEAD/DEAH box helicase [Paracoccaceae bacterium]